MELHRPRVRHHEVALDLARDDMEEVVQTAVRELTENATTTVGIAARYVPVLKRNGFVASIIDVAGRVDALAPAGSACVEPPSGIR